MGDITHYTHGAPPQPRLAQEDTEAGDGSAVVWPLLLLYDETSQTDFVEAFDDRCLLEEQLQLMFPADRKVDWDEEGKYVWHDLCRTWSVMQALLLKAKLHRWCVFLLTYACRSNLEADEFLRVLYFMYLSPT